MILKKESLGDPVFSFSNKIIRILWAITYNVFFRFSPTPFFQYRGYILRMFGAKIGKRTAIYPTVKIWLPSNLIVGDEVALAPEVKVYNQGLIVIKNKAIVSQGAHLCAGAGGAAQVRRRRRRPVQGGDGRALPLCCVRKGRV